MAKWKPYLPREFLCCISLQAGVVACATIGLTVVIVTSLVNIYDENSEEATVQAVQYVLLAIYLCVMYSGYILAFLASFWETSKLVRLAAYVLSAGLILYTIMAILSLVPVYNVMIYVCPGLRCPDHHWLYPDRWRKILVCNSSNATTKIPPQYTTAISTSSSEGSTLEITSEQTPHSLSLENSKASGALWMFSSWIGYKNLDLNESSNGNTTNGFDDYDSYIPEQTDKESYDEDEDETNMNEVLFIIVSVIYILMYIGFLIYTVLTALAFANKLEI